MNLRFGSKTQCMTVCWFRSVYARRREHQHGVSIQISINMSKTFLRISRIQKKLHLPALTRVLGLTHNRSRVSSLSMIVRVKVVLNRTGVDSD